MWLPVLASNILVTWFGNDKRIRNEIDLMLVRSRWASSVIDCRVCNGAQAGSEEGSDHAMVRARVRLRMKAAHLFRLLALDWARVNCTTECTLIFFHSQLLLKAI